MRKKNNYISIKMRFDGGMKEKIVPSLLQTNIIFMIEFVFSLDNNERRKEEAI